MPPFLPILLAGAGVVAVYRLLSRELARHAEAARDAAEELRQGSQTLRDLGTLERDPETGVYVPRQARR